MMALALRKQARELHSLRDACARVAGAARLVRIDEGRIADYTRTILDTYPLVTALDAGHFASPDTETAAAYVMALDTVNFGSGWFAQAGIEYADIAGGLKRSFQRGRLNTAGKWARATAEDCAFTFRGPPDLMQLFAEHLNATGYILARDYGGRVLHLVEEARGSAAALVSIVGAWSHFRDVSVYDGFAVPFLKRAQIFAADLQLSGAADFHDMEVLTVFADNMVPHVLRRDGILVYDPVFAARIDAGVALKPGGMEEVELRACAIHAVELMKAAARAEGRPVTAVNIDHLLWNRGYEDGFSGPLRPHVVRGEWY